MGTSSSATSSTSNQALRQRNPAEMNNLDSYNPLDSEELELNSYDKLESNEKSKRKPSLLKDLPNVILLVVLYLIQGVPNGLATGSIPFLLKEKLSYAQIAVFSLATYPYSLKLLWSPVVDSAYLPSVGRRKTWIVPIQLLSAFLLYWLGNNIDQYMTAETIDVSTLTIFFTSLVFLSATQDIAVDGWALTLLSEENLSYASTCQTIGLTTGYFMSFTIFLALNSAEFCNKYLRAIPSDIGIVTLSSYLIFWGLAYFLVTVYLILFKKEAVEETHEDMSITETYKTIVDICRLPHVLKLIGILLIYKIGFICNDAVTSLKLIEFGFRKEDLALIALIDFPFQIVFGFYAAKWSIGARPLKPWLYAIYGRLLFSFLASFVVMAFPSEGVTTSYFLLVIVVGVITSFTSTVQFVGMSAFFNQIADPYIGGTYMTFLNTLSNLGGTWPKYFVLEAVEYFTIARCSVPDAVGKEFSCVAEESKQICRKLGGQCNITQDGFYWVNSITIFIALFIFTFIVLRMIRKLEVIPPVSWKIRRQ